MIGVGLSIVQLAVRQLLGFSPLSLFAAGEPGAWWDPSDMSTLFQDSAGTAPVTAVEQPVGLMLDKSKGLVLGPELVTNGDFSNGTTGWLASGAALSVENDRLKVVASGSGQGAYQNITNLVVGKRYKLTASGYYSGSATLRIGLGTAFAQGTYYDSAVNETTNKTYTLHFVAPATTVVFWTFSGAGTCYWDNISVRELPGNHATQSTSASRPVLSARVNQYVGTETLATQNVTTGAATYTLRFEGAGTITLSGTKTGVYSAGTHTLTGVTAGTLTSTVLGSVTKADLRVANDGVGLPAYQRVNTSTDYDTAGFPQAESFDGVDDFQIAASGGGSTTAFFFCASIRVNKVGSTQTVFSDTGTNTGYRVRINASNQLEFSAGNGSAYTTVNTTATLGIGSRVVITCWHDGTNLNAQINNGTVAQAAFATATAGTAQITMGRMNNSASNYFGGRIFESIYVKDDVLTSAQIASTKAFCAAAGRITL